jgi:Short C-terminal domain/Phospholipase_D-nuclease N-terminal
MSGRIVGASGYPLLDAFWTMLWFFLWILWIFLVIRILIDVFRSDDMGGWAKAGWTVFIVVLPLIGVLVYLIARGQGMAKRDVKEAQAQDAELRDYVRDAAGPQPSVGDELGKLAALRDSGVLTDAEFAQQKARLLGGGGSAPTPATPPSAPTSSPATPPAPPPTPVP